MSNIVHNTLAPISLIVSKATLRRTRAPNSSVSPIPGDLAGLQRVHGIGLQGHSVSTQPILTKVPRCPSPILPKKFLKLLWLV